MKVINLSEGTLKVLDHTFQAKEVREIEEKTAERLMRVQPVRLKEYSELKKPKKYIKKVKVTAKKLAKNLKKKA